MTKYVHTLEWIDREGDAHSKDFQSEHELDTYSAYVEGLGGKVVVERKYQRAE